MADGFAEGNDGREERQVRFDAEVEALGVEARVEVTAAPFVIVGRCDGRGFYLRERHGTYRVTIAPEEDPGSDPYCPVCGVPLAQADRWRWTRPPEVGPR